MNFLTSHPGAGRRTSPLRLATHRGEKGSFSPQAGSIQVMSAEVSIPSTSFVTRLTILMSWMHLRQEEGLVQLEALRSQLLLDWAFDSTSILDPPPLATQTSSIVHTSAFLRRTADCQSSFFCTIRECFKLRTCECHVTCRMVNAVKMMCLLCHF